MQALEQLRQERAFDNIVVVLDGALCWMVRVRESEALDSRWYYYPALIDVLNKLETASDLVLRSVTYAALGCRPLDPTKVKEMEELPS